MPSAVDCPGATPPSVRRAPHAPQTLLALNFRMTTGVSQLAGIRLTGVPVHPQRLFSHDAAAPLSIPSGLLRGRARGIHVDPVGQVGTVHHDQVGPLRQPIPGPPVTVRRRDDVGPMLPAEQDRMAGLGLESRWLPPGATRRPRRPGPWVCRSAVRPRPPAAVRRSPLHPFTGSPDLRLAQRSVGLNLLHDLDSVADVQSRTG